MLPQCYPNATPMLPQCYPNATPKPGESVVWARAVFVVPAHATTPPWLPNGRLILHSSFFLLPSPFSLLPSPFSLHLQSDGGPFVGLVGVVGARIGEDDLFGFPVFEEREVGQVEPAAVLVLGPLGINSQHAGTDELEAARVHLADYEWPARQVALAIACSQVARPEAAPAGMPEQRGDR